MTGMRVERFFLFFPPKLVSFRRGETEYGIGMIPLGRLREDHRDEPGGARGRPSAASTGRTSPGSLEQIEGADSSVGDAGVDRGRPRPLSPDVLKRAYYNQPVWKRIVVIAAGPAMNILIAFVILFFLALG